MTVYVSIGNSDGKLSQQDWSYFQERLLWEVRKIGRVHGVWYSLPNTPFQNMCVCADVVDIDMPELRTELAKLAARFRQDSIAWAEATTTFITPGEQE